MEENKENNPKMKWNPHDKALLIVTFLLVIGFFCLFNNSNMERNNKVNEINAALKDAIKEYSQCLSSKSYMDRAFLVRQKMHAGLHVYFLGKPFFKEISSIIDKAQIERYGENKLIAYPHDECPADRKKPLDEYLQILNVALHNTHVIVPSGYFE